MQGTVEKRKAKDVKVRFRGFRGYGTFDLPPGVISTKYLVRILTEWRYEPAPNFQLAAN